MGKKIGKKNINILKTCNTYLSMLLLGLSVSIMGPCLLDLQRLVNTDTQRIAFIYTSRSLGYLVGAILSGVVLVLVRSKMLVLMACSLFITISMFGIPWSKNIDTLLAFVVVNGVALGGIETGGNVVIIQIWGSGPLLQILHFSFGLGAFISPLVAAPFLEDQTNPQYLLNTTDDAPLAYFDTNTTRNFSESVVHDGIAKLTYPFSIIGIFGVLVTSLFIVTWLISPYEDGESQSEEGDSKRSCLFMSGTIFFIFLVFFVVTGTQIGFGQTLATYAVKSDVRATAAVGSYMTSAYWAAFTTMRLVGALLAIRLSSMTLLVADICLISSSGLMLLFCMPDEGALWAVAVVFGSGIASTYASLVGWLNNYIRVTSKISAIVTVGCAAGEMIVPFIITFFMEKIPDMLAYVVTASSVVSTVLILILCAIFKKSEKKRPPIEIKCYVISKEAVIS